MDDFVDTLGARLVTADVVASSARYEGGGGTVRVGNAVRDFTSTDMLAGYLIGVADLAGFTGLAMMAVE